MSSLQATWAAMEQLVHKGLARWGGTDCSGAVRAWSGCWLARSQTCCKLLMTKHAASWPAWVRQMQHHSSALATPVLSPHAGAQPQHALPVSHLCRAIGVSNFSTKKLQVCAQTGTAAWREAPQVSTCLALRLHSRAQHGATGPDQLLSANPVDWLKTSPSLALQRAGHPGLVHHPARRQPGRQAIPSRAPSTRRLLPLLLSTIRPVHALHIG